MSVNPGVLFGSDPSSSGGAIPRTYYYNGYYPASSSNYWTNANTTYGDFTAVGTIPTITQAQANNFPSISNAASSLPGISFTANRTGTIEFTIFASVQMGVFGNAVNIRLIESNTSTVIGSMNCDTGQASMQSFGGFFSATNATAYNFKLQASVNTGTVYIGSSGSPTGTGSQLTFIMKYVS